MKNYTFYSSADQEGEDYGCIQCIVSRHVAFELLQLLASQLQDQEVRGEEDSDEVRMMLYGDINTLQE